MVRQPPGGASSFNIFGADPSATSSAPRASAIAAAVAPVASQEPRAVQPPGGRSQMGSSFGWDDSNNSRGQSSNAFANGASQNVGNVITDRSSSRVLAPPGGRSQMGSSFGWDDSNSTAESRSNSSNTGGRGQSSNAYANGASQNVGNVITDRSSSRVLAPPGGRSQMGSSFGWDDSNSTAASRNNSTNDHGRGQSSNAFANGANQNVGNMITDRSSSRILAPPGGKTTLNIFGGGDDQPSSSSNSRGQSSNAYANGASQNVGNVITDRSSSRVLAPPGGKTTLNIFGGGDQPEPHPVGVRATSSNAYANGANQNVGNMITDRPTSRVLAPPGGKTTLNIFGGGDDSAPARRTAAADHENRSSNVPPPSGPSVSQASKGQSSNAFANGASQNVGNVITDRPSSRVLAPPGGKSSMGTSFGW